MRTALLLLAMIAAPAFAAGQDIWKWVDEKGVTHYSDRAVPGATKMDISTGNRMDSRANQPTYTSASEPSAPAGPAYRSLQIAAPRQDESLINTGGRVTVEIAIEPMVRTDHQLYLYLDGAPVSGFAPGSTLYELKEVPRGTHTAMAVVTDRRGARVQQSDSRTFHVRQESIANPPVGPTLRPQPPKPRNNN